MARHLILYHSHHGQTKKICTFIAHEMQKENINPELVNVDEITDNFDLSVYQSALFGMPVRYGKHDKRMVEFICQNANTLNQINTGLFSVNLTARKEDKNTPESNPYLKKLLKEIPVKPNLAAVMAGALKYKEYRWLDRLMIRLIMKITKGPVDTSVNTEFTQWEQVTCFAKQYTQVISG